MSTATPGNPAHNPDPLLTAPEVAEWLRLSERFVRKLIAEGDLPAVRFGRAVRVRLSDLRAYAGVDR